MISEELIQRDLLEALRSVKERDLRKLDGTINFKCLDNCGKCCSLPIILNEEEAKKAGLPYEVISDGRVRNIKKKGLCQKLDPERKKCLVYPNRPSVCKAYPIQIDPLTGETYYDASCLGVGKGEILGKEQIEEMLKQRRFFWDSLNLTQNEKQMIHDYLFEKRRVRYLVDKESPQLVKKLREIDSEFFPAISVMEGSISDYADRLLKKGQVVVAGDNGDIEGILGYFIKENVVGLDLLWVAPEKRDSFVMYELLTTAIKKERDFKGIVVAQTWEGNSRMRRLLEICEFLLKERIPRHYIPERTSVIYETTMSHLLELAGLARREPQQGRA